MACVSAIEKHYEVRPNVLSMVVLVADSFDEFTSNKWLIPLVSNLIENCDAAVFALSSELPQVHNFFYKPKDKQCVGHALCYQQSPFPRLKFFTLSTAMGQTLEDSEILFPSLTVGNVIEEKAVPIQKFISNGQDTRFFMTDQSWKPLARRAIPGEGNEAVTVITPAKLLVRMLKALVNNPDTQEGYESWENAVGVPAEDFGIDDMQMMEASSNITDLIMEFSGYAEAPDAE